MKFKVEYRFNGGTWRESMNSGLFCRTFDTEALAQSAIERYGSNPRSNYRIVIDNPPSPPTAPIIQRVSLFPTLRELLLKAHDRNNPKEKTMSKNKTKAFDDFPDTLYIVYHEGGYVEFKSICARNDNPGYFLAFDDEVEAAEDAQNENSQVARYEFYFSGSARVDKEVVYE